MAKARLWSGLCAAGIAFVMAAPAHLEAQQDQVRAAVVTRDGQRHEGRNLGYRIDEREVAVRTGLHTEPRVPIDQVAYVEFVGAPQPDAAVRPPAGQHVVVLRDGRRLEGQAIEMGHEDRANETTPYLVTFRTQDGQEHRFQHHQVSRVYFAAPGETAAIPTTGQQPGETSVTVPATQQWTPTGITVREGEQIRLQASGQIQLSRDGNDTASAAGSLQRRPAGRQAPLPGTLAGALIGRIGTGTPFGIGDQTTVTMPASGQLFLGINDDSVQDNSGQFTVVIHRETQAQPRRRPR